MALRKKLNQRFPGWKNLCLTDWESAGIRRAAVLWSHYNSVASSCGTDLGLRWVRARAWVAISWACGLRMGSDTTALTRSHARPDLSGRGWTLSLAATKDDPFAQKKVVRSFSWSETNDLCVAAFLAEYLCVRDAIAGTRDGALITDIKNSQDVAPLKKSYTVATRDLGILAELAGLPQHFTSYSTRKGFATQAHDDGWSLEEISESLRHVKLDTTRNHYLPGLIGKNVAAKALSVFAQTGAGSQ